MGTIKNGSKWLGSCVGGKIVKGLAKNGIVFYKKFSPVTELYKRRIMINDNLRDKYIYSTIPDDYVDNLIKRIGSTTYSKTVVTINDIGGISEYSMPSMSDGSITYYVSTNIGNESDFKFYYCSANDKDSFVKNDFVKMKNDEDYVVTEIIDNNESYKHLFIEDNNIRPVRVGDKIISGTKIYFNYPDDYYKQWPADGSYNDVILIETEDYTKSFYHARYSGGDMTISLDSFESFPNSYSHNIYDTSSDGKVNTNLSYIEFTKDEGTVTSVDYLYSHDAASKYILVDETTLG